MFSDKKNSNKKKGKQTIILHIRDKINVFYCILLCFIVFLCDIGFSL